MRTSVFLLLLFAMIGLAAAIIKAPDNERAKTFRALQPSMDTIAKRLPSHATTGVLGIHIHDGEFLNELRWMLYPRTVERALANNPAEWGMLLLISNKQEADTVSPRIIARSNLLFSCTDSFNNYWLIIPEKARK